MWDRLDALDRRLGIKRIDPDPTPEQIRTTRRIAFVGLAIGLALGIVVGWGTGDWARSLVVIIPAWMTFGGMAMRSGWTRTTSVVLLTVLVLAMLVLLLTSLF